MKEGSLSIDSSKKTFFGDNIYIIQFKIKN